MRIDDMTNADNPYYFKISLGGTIGDPGVLVLKTREHNAKPPYRFFRDNMTIDDIIEESKFDFKLSVDESKDIDKYNQTSMWDDYLDSNNGCSESCEVF